MEQHPTHEQSPRTEPEMLNLVFSWPEMGDTPINKLSFWGSFSMSPQSWSPPAQRAAAELSWTLAARKGFLPRPAIGL